MPELPHISGDEAIKIFQKLGFSQVRQKGSHVVMRRGRGDVLFQNTKNLHSVLAEVPLNKPESRLMNLSPHTEKSKQWEKWRDRKIQHHEKQP
jgi:predicted RNA binding protein YcfA (HicA-like mRNA interferase family)